MSELSALDTPLLRKAVEWVLDQERLGGEWVQDTWGEGTVAEVAAPFRRRGSRYQPLVDCGTSCCVAGKICLLAGDTMVYQLGIGEVPEPDEVVEVFEVRTADGRVVSIPTRAAELLGVSTTEAMSMFRGSLEASGVLARARALAAAHGEELGL